MKTQPKTSTPRVQKHRENLQQKEAEKVSKLSDPEAQQSLRRALDFLRGSGLALPDIETMKREPFADQMLAIQRLLAAAQTGMRLAVQRGELRKTDYLNECLGRLMAYMRRTLRTAPARADSLGLPPEQTAILREQLRIITNQIIIELAKDLQHVIDYAKETEEAMG